MLQSCDAPSAASLAETRRWYLAQQSEQRQWCSTADLAHLTQEQLGKGANVLPVGAASVEAAPTEAASQPDAMRAAQPARALALPSDLFLCPITQVPHHAGYANSTCPAAVPCALLSRPSVLTVSRWTGAHEAANDSGGRLQLRRGGAPEVTIKR